MARVCCCVNVVVASSGRIATSRCREIKGGGGRETVRVHCHRRVVDVTSSGTSPRHHHKVGEDEGEGEEERGGGMSSGQGRR